MGKQYGSIEIYIEAGLVTHITEKVIKKYNKPKQTWNQGNKKIKTVIRL